MAIKRVWIEPGCIGCWNSQDTCPQVFQLRSLPAGARVRPEVVDFTPYEAQIREAAANCPARVIHFEEGS